MARPIKNSVDYFYMNTKPCKTLRMLESKFGNAGFVFFWKLFMLLAEEDGHFYDARDPVNMEFLAQELSLPVVSVTEMLDTLSFWTKLDQVAWGHKLIWYQGFVDSLKDVYEKRKRPLPTLKDAIEKIGGFCPRNSNTIGVSVTETTPDTGFLAQKSTESTQSRVEESREEEIKSEEILKGTTTTDTVRVETPQKSEAEKKTDSGGVLGKFKEYFFGIVDQYCDVRIAKKKVKTNKAIYRNSTWLKFQEACAVGKEAAEGQLDSMRSEIQDYEIEQKEKALVDKKKAEIEAGVRRSANKKRLDFEEKKRRIFEYKKDLKGKYKADLMNEAKRKLPAIVLNAKNALFVTKSINDAIDEIIWERIGDDDD
ncbi:hypothetical protein LCGC14_0452200 [marine sediment metagenome]|uniref:Lin1244/Lin1753-like N-terminal domain-containing protein n=1 Tax=marine sediment metagenome TaxID=412755 RepID=A0A0F9SMW9_9ZZZZ